MNTEENNTNEEQEDSRNMLEAMSMTKERADELSERTWEIIDKHEYKSDVLMELSEVEDMTPLERCFMAYNIGRYFAEKPGITAIAVGGPGLEEALKSAGFEEGDFEDE